MKTAVDNIASLNRPWYNIILSGGEPTIHPHISDLLSMFHERLGESLNVITIISNGSRNETLYKKIAEVSKSVFFVLNISIHTDHVDMEHILGLIENLSGDVNLYFSLMFNPDKREMVHEIYETMFEYRKKFWFEMNVVTLREGDIVDPRYTPEDFAWQKEAIKKFNGLTRNIADKFSARRETKHRLNIIRDVEDNGKIRTVNVGNRTLALSEGLLKFGGMYCIAHAALLFIMTDGRCKGMVCDDDREVYNIFDKDSFQATRNKLIHAVRCTKRVCGCAANDRIPKFASEEEAKKYVEFAQKRQAQLFDEYLLARKSKTNFNLPELVGMNEDFLKTYFGVADDVRKITEYEYNSGDKKSKVVYRAENGIITEAICALK